MPIHTIATGFGDADLNWILGAAAGFVFLYSVKVWAGGRKCTWEREWAGKMILIAAPPTPTIISLIDHLLHLPSPPQILFLPPIPSPLPDSLLTLLHTIRLGTESNRLAQLHCEALPQTPSAVRDFTRKWATPQRGTTGEDGRRVDAIVLGSGWEVSSSLRPVVEAVQTDQVDGATSTTASPNSEKPWSTHQFQFHFLTSLLPYLLRSPAERNIRIISLVSPTWSAALPSLQGKTVKEGPATYSARKGLTTLLLMRHFQLILDTLASAAYGKKKDVPDPLSPDAGVKKKRDADVRSNIMGVSVVMPWARSEVVKGFLGADESLLAWILFIIFFPLVLILTPSPKKSIQSILFALSAPVRHGEIKDVPAMNTAATAETHEPRRAAVAGGDVVRNCGVVDLPPVLTDPALAKANYDAVEKEVETRIKADSERLAKPSPTAT